MGCVIATAAMVGVVIEGVASLCGMNCREGASGRRPSGQLIRRKSKFLWMYVL